MLFVWFSTVFVNIFSVQFVEEFLQLYTFTLLLTKVHSEQVNFNIIFFFKQNLQIFTYFSNIKHRIMHF